jgi:hypothetical protein
MALLRLLLAAAAAVATGPPLNSSSSSSSSTRKFLLLNTSLLQNSSGVRWTMHPPVLAEQPAITPERPWEQWGVAAVQVIEWSPGDKRLYYTCRERLPGLNAKGEPKVLSRLCLASSVDGKEWHRKSLGLVEHPPGSGNTDNNIVWPSSHPDGTPTSGFAPMSFFRDLSPSAACGRALQGDWSVQGWWEGWWRRVGNERRPAFPPTARCRVKRNVRPDHWGQLLRHGRHWCGVGTASEALRCLRATRRT